MTYALVMHSQFIKVEKHDSFTWNNLQYTNVPLLTKDERTAAGIFDFIRNYTNPPEGQRESGRDYEVDNSAGTVTEVISYVPIEAI